VSIRHPVVGTWRVSVEIPGAPAGMINLATFSLDGGVVVAFPSPTPAPPGANHHLEYWTPALGRWAATDDRSATMTFIALGVDENGASVGTHTIAATATANADAATWSGPFTITVAGPDGSKVAEVSGTVTGTRITA
jgi:hypothetical protein